MKSKNVSRRKFLASTSMAGTSLVGSSLFGSFLLSDGFGTLRFLPDGVGGAASERAPLREFEYGDVTVSSAAHKRQLEESMALLMELSDDSLLKPLRAMSGQPAPGEELGGWYLYDPKFDGSAPGGRGLLRRARMGSGCLRWRGLTRLMGMKKFARRY